MQNECFSVIISLTELIVSIKVTVSHCPFYLYIFRPALSRPVNVKALHAHYFLLYSS